MTPPPTNIDGTDITGATIDGTDVTEITVDGDTVFAALDIPDSVVAQDLVAWYRFEDGDARDYTATLNGQFADSTAYDGTVNGATFRPSGGVRDFNNGANSGAFEGDGTDDDISFLTPSVSTPLTASIYAKLNKKDPVQNIYTTTYSNGDLLLIREKGFGGEFQAVNEVDGSFLNIEAFVADTQWHMHTVTITDSSIEYFIDAQSQGTNSSRERTLSSLTILGTNQRFMDGFVDDFRIYDRDLTNTEISDIYNATEP